VRRILCISWRARITNEEVRRRTNQPPLTHIIGTTRLKFFRHIARADPSVDHSRALVWPLFQGTGTADRADRVTSGPGPLKSLSSSTESSSLEHAGRNGNAHQRTSHTMMMIMMTMMMIRAARFRPAFYICSKAT